LRSTSAAAAYSFAALPIATPLQRLECFGAVLLQPLLLLIDHGHFQYSSSAVLVLSPRRYNGVSIGLALLAAALLQQPLHHAGALRRWPAGRLAAAAVLYTLAVNYKQIAAYYGPAMAVALLRLAVQPPGGLWTAACRLLLLSVVVAAVQTALFWPFLQATLAEGWPRGMGALLSRLFPAGRGLFEDYVASVWCVAEPLLRARRAPVPTLVALAAGLTLLAALPGCLLFWPRPSGRNFLLCLFSCALSFYMLSYHGSSCSHVSSAD
jgi:alpha-1,3-glucosyltransferase